MFLELILSGVTFIFGDFAGPRCSHINDPLCSSTSDIIQLNNHIKLFAGVAAEPLASSYPLRGHFFFPLSCCSILAFTYYLYVVSSSRLQNVTLCPVPRLEVTWKQELFSFLLSTKCSDINSGCGERQCQPRTALEPFLSCHHTTGVWPLLNSVVQRSLVRLKWIKVANFVVGKYAEKKPSLCLVHLFILQEGNTSLALIQQ